jgi:hypothetical protein
MDQITLAVVSDETTVTQALNSFRKGSRGLVVRSQTHQPLLWTARDLLHSCNSIVDSGGDPGKVQLRYLSPTRVPVLAVGYTALRPMLSKHFSVLGPNRPVNLDDYGRLFDAYDENYDERYAIHQIQGDSAIVVTASERFTSSLNKSSIICKCVGDPIHRFEQSELVNPLVCNKPHGVAVSCTAVS